MSPSSAPLVTRLAACCVVSLSMLMYFSGVVCNLRRDAIRTLNFWLYIFCLFVTFGGGNCEPPIYSST